VTTLNPVSATERFLRDYSASQARMGAYQQMSEAEQNAFDYRALHPPTPGRLEGLGLPNPRSPEEWGVAAATLMPWRFPAERANPLNVHVREGPSYSMDPRTGEYGGTHPYRTKHAGGGWHDVTSVEKAAIATDERGRFLGSTNWIPGNRNEPTYLANIYVQPEHRSNQALFRQLTQAALADAQQKGTGVRMYFANPKLEKVAYRFFMREGWKRGESFFPTEHTYYPPGYKSPSWHAGAL
jgi:hypothetical protein